MQFATAIVLSEKEGGKEDREKVGSQKRRKIRRCYEIIPRSEEIDSSGYDLFEQKVGRDINNAGEIKNLYIRKKQDEVTVLDVW